MLRQNQRPGDADYFDVSFSGIKTAVLHAVEDGTPSAPAGAAAADGTAQRRADIARGFQDAVIGTLVAKTARAALEYGRTRIVVGGGVACNRALAAALQQEAATFGATVFTPSPRLATDNAAMIARAGLFRLARGEVATLGLNAYATAALPGLRAA
jgi:N6-L-threonylcarbamoyladenine synthase